VRIADSLLAEFKLQAVDITVHKPQAPIEVPFGDVAVTVHRARVRAGDALSGARA